MFLYLYSWSSLYFVSECGCPHWFWRNISLAYFMIGEFLESRGNTCFPVQGRRQWISWPQKDSLSKMPQHRSYSSSLTYDMILIWNSALWVKYWGTGLSCIALFVEHGKSTVLYKAWKDFLDTWALWAKYFI